MSDHSRYYISGAFVLGAVVALGISNIRHHDREATTAHQLGQQRKVISNISKINNIDATEESLGKSAASIKEGIEGCIGNTPLIKIKSLSEATGCEILAKAEVAES